jgi:hypothetical protein
VQQPTGDEIAWVFGQFMLSEGVEEAADLGAGDQQ